MARLDGIAIRKSEVKEGPFYSEQDSFEGSTKSLDEDYKKAKVIEKASKLSSNLKKMNAAAASLKESAGYDISAIENELQDITLRLTELAGGNFSYDIDFELKIVDALRERASFVLAKIKEMAASFVNLASQQESKQKENENSDLAEKQRR